MSYSDILATAALAISLLTSAWAGWRTWTWDRPVMAVWGVQMMGGSNEPDRIFTVFRSEVVNTGNHSTQLLDAYWEVELIDGGTVSFAGDSGRPPTIEEQIRRDGRFMLFPYLRGETVPDFPLTLERYERAEWEFLVGDEKIAAEKIRRVRPVVQFTSRKRYEIAYGAWQKSLIGRSALA